MFRNDHIGERAAALFVVGFLAFTPPLLAIFSQDAAIFGVPLLYGYLLAAWALLVVLIGIQARVISQADKREQVDLQSQSNRSEAP